MRGVFCLNFIALVLLIVFLSETYGLLDLTKLLIRTIIAHTFSESNSMAPKYKIGQKVTVAVLKRLSARDSGLEQYAGQTGEVTNYHWVSPPMGEVFYVYTVRIGTSNKEVVLHEDEIELMRRKTSSRR